MNNTREVVKQFILENFLPGEDPKNLTDDTELKESGILDSLSTLKLVTFLEEHFKIELEASDLDAGNQHREQIGVERQLDRQHRILRVEGIEHQLGGMAVGDREGHQENSGDGTDDERNDTTQHGRYS